MHVSYLTALADLLKMVVYTYLLAIGVIVAGLDAFGIGGESSLCWDTLRPSWRVLVCISYPNPTRCSKWRSCDTRRKRHYA